MERHLAWPDLLNARDLGGLSTRSGKETAWRRVVRADNLNKLAPAGVTAKLSHANVAKAIAAVTEASPGGVVIHCHAGKERTGIVAALVLSLAGVPDETVAEERSTCRRGV